MTNKNHSVRFLASKKSWLVFKICLGFKHPASEKKKHREVEKIDVFHVSQRPEDVNPMSFEELTPLHAAAQLGHEEAPKKP